MSPLVLSVPSPARAGHGGSLGHSSPFDHGGPLSYGRPRPSHGHLLTKRRSIDFGRVATSLCRSA